MNLMVFGDYNNGDRSTFDLLKGHLDFISDEKAIKKVVTFNVDGISYLSTVWAHDSGIPFEVVSGTEKFDLENNRHLPRWFLRKMVDDYKIDAFLFVFIQKGEDQSMMRKKIRYLYRQASRKMHKPVYVNLKNNLISLF